MGLWDSAANVTFVDLSGKAQRTEDKDMPCSLKETLRLFCSLERYAVLKSILLDVWQICYIFLPFWPSIWQSYLEEDIISNSWIMRHSPSQKGRQANWNALPVMVRVCDTFFSCLHGSRHRKHRTGSGAKLNLPQNPLLVTTSASLPPALMARNLFK